MFRVRAAAPSILIILSALAPSCKIEAETGEPSIIPQIFLEPAFRGVLPRGVPLRKVYPKGLQLTAEMEGLRQTLYDDPAGYCTIGFGHLVRLSPCDGTEPEQFRKGLTHEQALELLADDMSLAEKAVMSLVTVHLTDGQYAALCDFTFNVGHGRLARSTFLRRVNEGEYHRARAELRRYVMANGRRLRGLVRRRERELELFFENLVVPREVRPADADLPPIDILADPP